MGPDIALAPNAIAQIWGFTLSNSHLTFSLISLIVVWILIFSTSRFRIKAGKFQIITEELYSFFKSKIDVTNLTPIKKKILLSIVLTLFILIIISNLFSVAPILSSITIQLMWAEAVPLFRSPTSDFSLTIALGLFVVLLWNMVAIVLSPVRYVGNFIKIGPLLQARTPGAIAMGFLDIFLWVMDIVSELAKIISISARLFGNIIAGEIIGIVMIFLVPYFVPIPFFILSLFSGLIQAFVFALLSLLFIAGSLENVRKEQVI